MKYITNDNEKIIIIPQEIELSIEGYKVFDKVRKAVISGEDLRDSWKYPPAVLPIVRKYFLMNGNYNMVNRVDAAITNMDWDFSPSSVNTWGNVYGEVGKVTYNGSAIEGNIISLVTLLCFGGRV